MVPHLLIVRLMNGLGWLIAVLVVIGVIAKIGLRHRAQKYVPTRDRDDVLCEMIAARQLIDPATQCEPPPDKWPTFELWTTPEATILREVERQLWMRDGSPASFALTSPDEESLPPDLLRFAKKALADQPRYAALGDALLRQEVEFAFQWTTQEIAKTKEPDFGLPRKYWGSQISWLDVEVKYPGLQHSNDRIGEAWRAILNRRVDSDELWTFDSGARAGLLLVRKDQEISRVSLMMRNIIKQDSKSGH